MTQGKLIVFEGTDGSGKKTQAEFLVRYLTNHNISHATIDFPRYKESFFGSIAEDLLLGKLGENIPPKLAVLPFACDRWQIKNDVISWLEGGKIVLSNRYTASSAVYHAAKLPQSEQQSFIEWVYKLEQEIIGLPKENLVLYFHMPVESAQSLIDKRGNTKDTYEKDTELLKTVETLYLSLVARYPHWKMIQCTKDSQIRPREEIHKEVLDVFAQNGIL
ncbi:MAG: Thymidylate kinase [uncultured bacterium]|uniref:Thymidylate kinase n=1 Tax=Candidatus Gottesmanbacteria bacterium RIFCSPLOWO2_01_FULL_43_11b TaxID=1798392 RepID=A0A1F6AGH2_9BACT|nr:MAG: Thymidylate kinase [uncultured bacterium]OGG23781.1 MAG: hypothetical protein A3A79_01060 [Candidatus Gottesmanbacteria bacterium RIFCSPLOWO2_01_FULL_43_11b]